MNPTAFPPPPNGAPLHPYAGNAPPAPTIPEPKDKDGDNSRHVAAVLAQVIYDNLPLFQYTLLTPLLTIKFTGSPVALGRLVQETVDLLVVAGTKLNTPSSAELIIGYIAPSSMRVLRCTPAALHQKRLASILHPDDAAIVAAVIDASRQESQQKQVYCRFTRMDRVGDYVLVDLSVEWIADVTHALLVGRLYTPTPIDVIHTLRIQNLQLKHAVQIHKQSAVSPSRQISIESGGPSLADKTAAADSLLRELEGSSWTPTDGNISPERTTLSDRAKGKRRMTGEDDLDPELTSLIGAITAASSSGSIPQLNVNDPNQPMRGIEFGEFSDFGATPPEDSGGLSAVSAQMPFLQNSVYQIPPQTMASVEETSFQGGPTAPGPTESDAATATKQTAKKPNKVAFFANIFLYSLTPEPALLR
ncbi:hypothetical protein HDU98_009731 [Podochytrium sp. JEL0797]|nr:hypothetical protein HDU98_009731 [Podochytrium sp. JEL0797]